MDGPKAELTRSLQYRLSAFLSLAIVVLGGCAAGFMFFSALDDAHLAQDKQLRQTADLIGRLQTGPVTLAAWKRIKGIGHDERVVVRFLRDGTNGRPAQSGPPYFSDLLQDGLHTVAIGTETWRVFVKTDEPGVRIAVAQQTKVRDAAATKSALRTLIPFAFFAPVLLLLVRVLVRRMFQSLRELSAELRQRAQHDLGQLPPGGLPSEVQPFVAEINRLLTRVEQTMALHNRFVADAAHELRSPLTAMTLQAERLAAADMTDEARRRMLALSAGLQRTRVMLDQLLTLARSQQDARRPATALSLQYIIRTVIEDLFALAEQKNIDLGVVSEDDGTVAADPIDLKVLTKNLIDNAIRYTPPGGRVDIDVRCADGVVDLIIDDSGPGIPELERARVFDPFYRVLGNGEAGSGLGLAITRTIADRLGASVMLADAPAPGSGLRVLVRFPAARPANGRQAISEMAG